MYKKESIINSDGEEVYSRIIPFKGRFRDNGYTMYAHGQTINRRISFSFPSGMTKTDIANLDLLSFYLLPQSNVIGYRHAKGNQPMTIVQIAKVINVQERQAYRFIKRMIDMKMMVCVDDRHIINPLYFLNGKVITDELYWLFHDTLDEHLGAWVKEAYRKRGGVQ